MKAKKPSNLRYQSICLPCESEAQYSHCVDDPQKFRQFVEAMIADYPELFPSEIESDFNLHDHYDSLKQGIRLRRIKVKATKEVYLIRPSSLLPYLNAKTEEIEKALYLRQWGVPFEALAYCFVRDAMYYYRAWISLGRNQLVGTTVKTAEKLPKHLIADEQHTRIGGAKKYLATTVGGGCLLGASVCAEASTASLEAGYGVFINEAREVAAEYEPETVCLDGWPATQEAWRNLVQKIVVIRCFLHAVLKIKAVAKGREFKQELGRRAWEVYQGQTKREFAQRCRRFKEWVKAQTSGKLPEAVMKIHRIKGEMMTAYDHPEAARTSNGLDRLMDYQDRVIYAMRYFHGTKEAAELAVRAMALRWNFHPYNIKTQAKGGRSSPFADLNGFQYKENWLHNLLCAASMGGKRL